MSDGVSIILPTYNRCTLLQETLESVLAQSEQPAEIIVVDDCSPDDTVEMLATYGDKLRLITKQSNQGKAHSINLALSECQHPLVWIVDDDDLMHPDALQTLTKLLQHNPEAGFAYGRHVRFSIDNAGNRQEWDTGYWTECASEEFLVRTMEDFFVHQPGMIFKRALVDQIGPLNENLVRSQDYDFLIRLARVASGVGTQDVIFFQRQHDGLRGTKENSFSATERDKKWMEYDQKIFRALRDDMDLSEFLPSGEQIQSPTDKRRALLQRGVIMGRKKLWDLAIQDFSDAATLGDAPLSDAETLTLSRAFSSKYGCEEIFDGSFPIAEYKQMFESAPLGSEICRSLSNGLRWRVREALFKGKITRAFLYSRFMLALRRAR